MDNKVISQYGAKLGPIGIAVYNSILYHANADGTGAWPSYATIAKQIGCSRPPVIDAVNKLVELDLLKKEVRPIEGDRHLSNLYTVLDVVGKGGLPYRVKEVYPVGKGGLPDLDPITKTPLTNKESGENNAGPDGPSTFADWQILLEPKSSNRPAVLRKMHESLYPGHDPPSFGYIGKVARKVGGAGRLAELLWQHSTRPPTGDVLAYVQGVAKRGKHGTDSDGRISIQGHHPTAATSEEFYGPDG